MIYKNKDIITNINEETINLGNSRVTLYNRDNGTASFRVQYTKKVEQNGKNNNVPVDFNKDGFSPRLDIVSQDGSIFTNEPIEVIDIENGVIQYIVTDYVLKHNGKTDVYLYLENNKGESSQVALFYFYIREDSVTRALGKDCLLYTSDAADE